MSALIRFKVSVPNPHDHLLHVRLEVDAVGDAAHLDLSMPVWSPGSYLVREYARHVQNFRAFGADGEPRHAQKIDKATWRVDAANCASIAVEYEVFAHDLNVRANHVDDTHAFFTGVATYIYPRGREEEPIELEIAAPADSDWQVFTGLNPLDESRRRFSAPNLDIFLDTPVELGAHKAHLIDVDGTAHRAVFNARTNLDYERFKVDLPKIIRANRDIFGDFPYDDYLFITLVSDGAGGGLEHLNSTALIYPRDRFSPGEDPGGLDDGYINFLRLCCHEHFHAWNVKRIRPERLGPFDYQNENYTRDLWTVEGVTSYYDTLGLVRAGIIDAQGYLKRLLKSIYRYERIPGRYLQSLEDSSFDAWIKLYRPDENTLNSTVSYYLKGELVCALLDLEIRHQTGGEKSLDAVLKHLWERYFLADGSGYPEGGYQAIIEEATGAELDGFFEAFIRGVEDFDWRERLARVGLEFERENSKEGVAWLGLETSSRAGRVLVSRVPAGSPAHAGGIYAGDEIVAIDGWKVEPGKLSTLLADKSPGQEIVCHVFRRGALREYTLKLGELPPDTYRLRTAEDASEQARALLKGWLGADEIEVEYTG